MKRISTVILVLVLLLLSVVNVSAIQVTLDGREVVFTEETGLPFIDLNNRTQVPFRVILEKFGAEVDWDPANRVAIATKDGIEVKVPIGEVFIYKNGVMIENDTAAVVKDGRTYLPIRAVMEAFGKKVSWDGASKTILIDQFAKEQPHVIIYSTVW